MNFTDVENIPIELLPSTVPDIRSNTVDVLEDKEDNQSVLRADRSEDMYLDELFNPSNISLLILPKEIINVITDYLDFGTIINFYCVNKYTRGLLNQKEMLLKINNSYYLTGCIYVYFTDTRFFTSDVQADFEPYEAVNDTQVTVPKNILRYKTIGRPDSEYIRCNDCSQQVKIKNMMHHVFRCPKNNPVCYQCHLTQIQKLNTITDNTRFEIGTTLVTISNMILKPCFTNVCPFNPRVCEWCHSPYRNYLHTHHTVCDSVIVKCDNRDCNHITTRRELPDHKKICEFGTARCEWCGGIYKTTYLEYHHLACNRDTRLRQFEQFGWGSLQRLSNYLTYKPAGTGNYASLKH